MKKPVFWKFTIFRGKHLFWSLFFNKVEGEGEREREKKRETERDREHCKTNEGLR